MSLANAFDVAAVRSTSTDYTVGPLPTTGALTSHRVLVSIGVLIGAAFVFQGVGDTNPTWHTAVVVLLVGVLLILTMRANASGRLAWLSAYPQGGPG